MLDNRLPPLNAVRAFDAAARLGSYVEASKALHVTQPAIGRHVKLLEEWLGVQLFERTSRGVVLTVAGEKYHRKVATALQLLIDAGKEVRPRTAERWLRIKVVPGFAKRWLMPRIEAMRHLQPGLKFVIDPDSTFTEVDGRSADLGIVYGVDGQYTHSRVILNCPRVFPVCTPGYLASIDPIQCPADLVKHHLIHVDDGEWWNLWFRAHGLLVPPDLPADHRRPCALSGQKPPAFAVNSGHSCFTSWFPLPQTGCGQPPRRVMDILLGAGSKCVLMFFYYSFCSIIRQRWRERNFSFCIPAVK